MGILEKFFNKNKILPILTRSSNNDSLLSRPLFGDVEVVSFEKNETDTTFLEKDLSLLSNVNKAIMEELDFFKSSTRIVDAIRENLNYILGVLFVVEKEKGIAYPYAISAPVIRQLENIFGKTTTDHVGVIKSQNCLILKSILTKDSYWGKDVRDFVSPVLSEDRTSKIQFLFRIKSAIAMPIENKGEVRAVLLVLSSRSDLPQKEKKLLGFLRDQVSIALKNSMLYQETREHLRDVTEHETLLENIEKISKFLSTTLDFDELSQKIVDIIPEYLGGGVLGGIFFSNEESSAGTQFKARNVSKNKKMDEFIGYFPVSVHEIILNFDDAMTFPMLKETILENKDIYLSDVLTDFFCPPFSPSVLHQIQQISAIESSLMVPVIVNNNLMGIVLFLLQDKILDKEDKRMHLMRSITDHLGVAIHNSQMFTDVKRTNEDLFRVNKELESLDKSKSDFLSITSHQLRTPVSVIRGNLSMILDGDYGQLPGEVTDVVKRTLKNTERISQAINEIMDVIEADSGRITLKKQSFSLSEILDKIVREYQNQINGKDLLLDYNPIPESIMINGDSKRISQVLTILIDNAVAYTEKGSISIGYVLLGNELSLQIRDTGIGFSTEILDKIFTRFERGIDAAKIKPDGTGVGLYLVKKILEEHGFSITIDSNDLGTTGTLITINFFLSLNKINLLNNSKVKKIDSNLINRPLFGEVEKIEIPLETSYEQINTEELKNLIKTNNVIHESLDFREVCQNIVDVIRDYLKFEVGTLFLIDRDRNSICSFALSFNLLHKLEIIFGKKIADHIALLNDINSLVVKSVVSNESFIGNDVRDFVSPTLPENKAIIIQNLLQIKTFIVTPFFINGEIRGALLLASNKMNIDSKELEIISCFRNQITTTLENSELYQESLSKLDKNFN